MLLFKSKVHKQSHRPVLREGPVRSLARYRPRVIHFVGDLSFNTFRRRARPWACFTQQLASARPSHQSSTMTRGGASHGSAVEVVRRNGPSPMGTRYGRLLQQQRQRQQQRWKWSRVFTESSLTAVQYWQTDSRHEFRATTSMKKEPCRASWMASLFCGPAAVSYSQQATFRVERGHSAVTKPSPARYGGTFYS